MKRISAFLMASVMAFSSAACGTASQEPDTSSAETEAVENTVSSEEEEDLNAALAEPPENFVLITGGTFEMGSPDMEGWRSEDQYGKFHQREEVV